jgi:Zincin-like metallopeptidase
VRVAAYPAPVRRFGGSSPQPAPGSRGRAGRPKSRDRHGRGIRGQLAPVDVPLTVSRAERFDEYVLDAVERVELAVKDVPVLVDQLAAVEYGIEEVPPAPALAAAADGSEPLALGRTDPAATGSPARVVLYRRPVELRTPDLADRAALVHEIVVDQLAELLAVTPDELDPPELG